MFFGKIVDFWNRFPMKIRGLWVIGLSVYLLGSGLNLAVISANNGKMPVPISAEGFYVIYPKYYRVAFQMTPDRMLLAGEAPGYTIMTEHSHFKPLAVRFYLVSPINIWRSLPSATTKQFIRSDIPVLGQEMQISIGNIIIWIANILLFFAATATTLFVLIRGFQHQWEKLREERLP